MDKEEWSEKILMLNASEKRIKFCKSCKGLGYHSLPCPHCETKGFFEFNHFFTKECHICSGKGTLKREGKHKCPKCNGKGLHPTLNQIPCPLCGGKKEITSPIRICDNCNGSGRVLIQVPSRRICSYCHGDGYTVRICKQCMGFSLQPRKICKDCMGNGFTKFKNCKNCKGTGRSKSGIKSIFIVCTVCNGTNNGCECCNYSGKEEKKMTIYKDCWDCNNLGFHVEKKKVCKSCKGKGFLKDDNVIKNYRSLNKIM